MDFLFESILGKYSSAASFFLCSLASIVLGLAVALVFMFKNKYTKSFVLTLATLPLVVQVVISLVNGNMGVGIAVMGAFSLVRFRSAPGTAREITAVFLVMAIGLATGMGFIGVAALTTVIVSLITLVFSLTGFGESKKSEKQLKITIPESLDYTDVFDDLFERYTSSASLERVKTTNMGSLFQLYYKIILKDASKEKEFIDALRCRNGNLDIICGRIPFDVETL